MKKQIPRLKRNENLVGWAFIAPTMTAFVLLTAFPFLCAIFLSLVEWKFFNGWKKLKFVGFQNFIDIFNESSDFMMALENTFVYVITIVPLSIILSLIFAYCMNSRIFGKKWLRMMFFIPYISSIVAVGTVFKFLFREDGIVNNILMNLSIIAEPVKWTIDPNLSKIPIILLSVWMSIGYQLILFTAAMQNVPVSLYEAGKIDGANSFKQFTKITLPLISPTIFYLLVTRTMAVFKIFGSVNILTMGTSMDSNTSVVLEIYQAAFSKYQFGTASAMAVILWILIMIVTVFNFWGQKKWVHY